MVASPVTSHCTRNFALAVDTLMRWQLRIQRNNQSSRAGRHVPGSVAGDINTQSAQSFCVHEFPKPLYQFPKPLFFNFQSPFLIKSGARCRIYPYSDPCSSAVPALRCTPSRWCHVGRSTHEILPAPRPMRLLPALAVDCCRQHGKPGAHAAVQVQPNRILVPVGFF